MSQYIHAVPNFSEGCRTDVIEAIVGEVRDIEGVKLIDYYPDSDFNRTVIEVIGKPAPLKEAMLNIAKKSYELIDMEKQRGANPRIGALDTIPLYPLANLTLEECIALAEEIGAEIYKRFEVPVFFAGESARRELRTKLYFIARGHY